MLLDDDYCMKKQTEIHVHAWLLCEVWLFQQLNFYSRFTTSIVHLFQGSRLMLDPSMVKNT